MPIEGKLSVFSIYPESDGGGEVEFHFVVPGSDHPTEFKMFYADADNPTDGVKEAAAYLAELADALAKEARALAE